MSVRDLAERLPDIEAVRRRSVALATLDAIISEEWESRWYSYDSAWGEHEQLGSMRNGSGDEYSIVFFSGGAFVRGFAHESEKSPYKRNPRSLWPGMTDGLPEDFQEFVDEPAFSDGNGVPLMTICLWRGVGAGSWSFGNLEQSAGELQDVSSDWLFERLLDESPQGYADFAREYFGVELELSDVASIYEGNPLTRDRAQRMNEGRDWGELTEELEQIGYPI